MDKENKSGPDYRAQSWRPKILNTVLWSGWLLFALAYIFQNDSNVRWRSWNAALSLGSPGSKHNGTILRSYNLTVGVKWMNLDGGRWRPMFVCNGQSPCPTLVANEGDEVNIHVINDLGAQISIHWSGMNHHRFGFWNDGTGGLNQYPILPRGNWTSKFSTAGHWGLNWYADHTGAGVADGVYGMIYVAPAAWRPRPYARITKSASEIREIEDAEARIKHIALWNSDYRTVDWKFSRLKGEGADIYCYKSVLVNGKGRVHCRDPQFDSIAGEKLDESGCVVQAGFDGQACKPSTADFEIIETDGQNFMMLNLINIGFEHALKFSVDNHKFWIVADDAGFIEPQNLNVLYITNGARFTVLIKLDQEPQDYAVRLASTSKFQNLVSYAILRYPAKRYPMLGFPMELPPVGTDIKICLNPDSSVATGCKELDFSSVRPYPESAPPKDADLTLSWSTGSRPSKYFKFITEYYVNQEPWQLFRAAMEPVFFTPDAQHVQKPIQNGLSIGTVVDLIVQNTLNETIPMYKHGDATYILGSGQHEEFRWSSVADAVKHKVPLNTRNPPLGLVHDLPPLGWIAIRWKVKTVGATMFHAVKLRYFALGMAAPLLEGVEHSRINQIPEYARSQPHIEFEPANSGVFG